LLNQLLLTARNGANALGTHRFQRAVPATHTLIEVCVFEAARSREFSEELFSDVQRRVKIASGRALIDAGASCFDQWASD